MSSMMERNLVMEIETYKESIACVEEGEILPIKVKSESTKSRDKIIALLAQDGKLSASSIAQNIGISSKAVEKHFARLKAEGVIERIGPAKGGKWIVK